MYDTIFNIEEVNEMTNLLINCWYDGMTIEQAKDFIRRNYQEEVTEKQLNKVKEIIKNQAKKVWR